MNESMLIFLQLLRRDIHIYRTRIWSCIVNDTFIRPVCLAITFAYLRPAIYFPDNALAMGTLFLAGQVVVIIMVLSFQMNLSLLFDLETTRLTDYKITLLHPALILFEQLVFTTLFTFIITVPFFPIAALFFRSCFDASNITWLPLFFVLLLGSLCCCSYHLFVACFMKDSKQIGRLWARFNLPMIILGGFSVPLVTLKKFSPTLGTIAHLNPLFYITEGLRQTVIGGNQFLPLTICIATLLALSTLFFVGACYFFKKRVDHI